MKKTKFTEKEMDDLIIVLTGSEKEFTEWLKIQTTKEEEKKEKK